MTLPRAHVVFSGSLLFHMRFDPTMIILAWASCYWLIQYHCIDCGATGPFRRRRTHVCDRVRQRWEEQVVTPEVVPLWVQFFFWCVVLSFIYLTTADLLRQN